MAYIFSKKVNFVLLLLAMVSGAFTWFFYQRNQNNLGNLKFVPESFGNEIVVKRFNKKGILQNLLASPFVTHFSDKNITVFKTPTLHVYSENQQPWTILSDKAEAINGFASIVLSGHVLLFQEMGNNNNSIRIETDKLFIDSEKQTAMTNDPVYFTEIAHDKSQMIIKAVGVFVNQKTGEIKLNSKVNAEHIPFGNQK